jgi:hypothetical protein
MPRFSLSKRLPLERGRKYTPGELRRLSDGDLHGYTVNWTQPRSLERIAAERERRRRDNWLTGASSWAAIAISFLSLVVAAIALWRGC